MTSLAQIVRNIPVVFIQRIYFILKLQKPLVTDIYLHLEYSCPKNQTYWSIILRWLYSKKLLIHFRYQEMRKWVIFYIYDTNLISKNDCLQHLFLYISVAVFYRKLACFACCSSYFPLALCHLWATASVACYRWRKVQGASGCSWP